MQISEGLLNPDIPPSLASLEQSRLIPQEESFFIIDLEDPNILSSFPEKKKPKSHPVKSITKPLIHDDNKISTPTPIIIDDEVESDDLIWIEEKNNDPNKKQSKHLENKALLGKRGASTTFSRTQQTKKVHQNQSSDADILSFIPISPLGPLQGPTKVVAIDCEMVKVQGNALALARLSIVNYDGNVIFDHFVKPEKRVIDYVTWIHGITANHLENCETYNYYKEEVAKLLGDNNIIVGHSLKVDLQILDLKPSPWNLRDLAKYWPMKENNCPMSLKNLCKKYLNVDIQLGHHNPVEDAQGAIALYRKFEEQWEKEAKDGDYNY